MRLLRPRRAATAAAILLASVPLLLALPGRTALANGRLPAIANTFPGPTSPAVLDLGATFGLVSTADDGATWRWVCEMSIGYIGMLDPLFLRTTTGLLLASTFQGLTRSADGGCTFDTVMEVGDLFVTGLLEHPSLPGTIYACTGGGSVVGAPAFYVSTDGGGTFAATTLTSVDILYSGIALTPADSQRIYVGGYRESTTERFIYRSDDGGAGWTELIKTGPAGSRLRVLAAGDTDPDVVFWLLDGPTDTLYRSDDGGLTETAVLTTPGTIVAFATAPNGVAYASTSYGDLQRSDDGGLSFAPLPGVPIPTCIATSGDRVYICSNPYIGNFAVGYSDDLGANWTSLLYLADVDGVLVCPAGTPTHDVCEPAWLSLEKFLNGLDGADGGVSGADSGSPGDAAPAADGGPPADAGKNGRNGDCGCRIASETSAGGPGAAGLVALAIALMVALRGRAVALAALAAVALAGLALASGCGSPADLPADLAFGLPDEAYWPGVTPSGNAEGRLYVTNNGEDTVSILEIETLVEIDRIPVGFIPVEREGPHHVAVSLDAEFYFVGISNFTACGDGGPHGAHAAGTDDGYALKIRVSDNTLVAIRRIDPNPGDVRLSPDGRWLLMSHFDLLRITKNAGMGDPALFDAALVVIDTETLEILNKTPICPAPHGLLPSADGSTVYAACFGSDQLAVVTLTEDAGGKVTAEVERVDLAPDAGDPGATRYEPYAVTISPLDGSVWASCWKDGSLRVYDPATGAMDPSRTTLVGGLPGFGDFTDDGTLLLMPRQQSDFLMLIDPLASPPDVLGQITPPPACTLMHAARFVPGDEAHALIVCEGVHCPATPPFVPGSVHRYDLAADLFDLEAIVGIYPDDLAMLP